MKGKLLFVVGLGAGYVVGARAGRPAYDGIVDRVERLTENPKVQDAAHAMAEKAASAAGGVVEAAKSASTGSSAPSAAPAASPQPAPPASIANTAAVQGGADESKAPTATD